LAEPPETVGWRSGHNRVGLRWTSKARGGFWLWDLSKVLINSQLWTRVWIQTRVAAPPSASSWGTPFSGRETGARRRRTVANATALAALFRRKTGTWN